MRTLTELQQQILKQEYPHLSLDSDSDVERYFELRKTGKLQEALSLYNSRLKQKYPDDAQRALLMRFYRSRDPQFQMLFRDSLVTLAERLISRTTYIITFLSKDIDTIDMKDAYSVIKYAEGIIEKISPDRYAAITFTEKYARYAKLLDFHAGEMERTAELIRMYVTNTLESVTEFKKEKEAQRKNQPRKTAQRKELSFDLSKINFTQDDIRRILIPSTVTRIEDIVIVYCLKYWNEVNDATFERTIFLYSKKYHTKHSEIFQAIKKGRDHNWKDEEILNSVLATVVSGYYYSISGDAYLQKTWAYYKHTRLMNKERPGSRGGVPVPAGHADGVQKTLHHKTAVKKAVKSAAVKKAKKERSPAIEIPAKPRSVPAAPQKPAAAKTVLQPKTGPQNVPRRVIKTDKSIKPVTPFKPVKGPAMSASPAAPAFVPNSIADIIKKMTGKTYTVYKDMFFRKIRPAIRMILSSSNDRKNSGFFGNRQNDAEEQIYSFLFKHYEDPYQNWSNSEEYKTVRDLGYHIPDIEPVISCWVRENLTD
ncbi:hypothetical protein K7I13_10715 [Brucepastera parasyntrophica]|uniref:hypothetical protein n=1 Tax=Brucepastera parasyntrophica TaxID=2880008 RepID=UPI00210B3307|nr:hypothetical protein [Brucepastera parasyntrophica]ULQ58984.1 hypothetical protein K7I13_10715 [Brucepastera parasyntrophica]